MAQSLEYLVTTVRRIHGLATRYDTAERKKILSDECIQNGPALVAEYRTQWREAFMPLVAENPQYAEWAEELDRLHRVYTVSLKYSPSDIAKLAAAGQI